MGMVKSAARTALLRPGSLEALLTDLNRVLFEVKAGSATYVTFACVRCHDRGKVEYSLAGNGPILHYHASSKTMSQLAMEQFPLGLFAHVPFQSGLVKVEPGDILALLTDGLPEVENANGEQFGLERIGELVARNATGPLAAGNGRRVVDCSLDGGLHYLLPVHGDTGRQTRSRAHRTGISREGAANARATACNQARGLRNSREIRA